MLGCPDDVNESLKILSDGEIRLELKTASEEILQFYYIIYDKLNNEVGQCVLRLLDNENNKYLGNIGYKIYEQHRGNHYAEKASRLLAMVAVYYGADNIKITADPANLPSIKTIENLGARFIEIRKVPCYIKLYKTSKKVKVYEWNLESEKRNDRY